LAFPARNVRAISATDDDFACAWALCDAIGGSCGRHRLVAIVASAGTTNTGAVDPACRIADVLHRRVKLWLHA
jgi:glutamate/tyrosine decarboxylase-like PLP-dependent enzyme